MLLRVAMFSSPLRSICTPTGVGQHILQMAHQLAEREDVALSLIAPRADYEQAKPHLSGGLSSVPVHYLPKSERLIRAALISTNLVSIDRWCRDVDWIYSPKEQPVRTRRARLAVTIHDLLPFEQCIENVSNAITRSALLRWKLLMRRIIQRADLIGTVSEFTRQRLIELLHIRDTDRIVVIGNGVGSEYFKPRQPEDVDRLQKYRLEPERYFVSVGSLTFRKGGDLLLKLAGEFLNRGLPSRIIVTGRRHDAELLARYESIRADRPQFPLELTGYITDAEQAMILRNATALLFPSRYEGFGIPALESMAAGTPAICMRTSALPEVAGDGAQLIDSEEHLIWLSAIENLVEDSAERAAIIARGRKRAASFTWDRCAKRLVAAMMERS